MPSSQPGWRGAMISYLEALAALDPAEAPVPPPATMAAVHAQAVAYRAQLGRAAQQWLAAVQTEDPAWVTRGADAYAAAEQARLAWYKALWERYTGEPAPGP